MIPIDYLRVAKRGREVKPKYLRDERAAAEVIQVAKSAKTVGQFRKAAEATSTDKKLSRGLAHLLERHMELEKLDAKLVARVRMEVFKTASQRGYPLTPEEREEIFRLVASRLGLGVDEVKKLFLKAYEENREIVKLPDIRPDDLTRLYNLALIQALLFKSLYIKAKLPNSPTHIKSLIRAVKGYRLMYIAEAKGQFLEFTFDGPVSALRQTERYGTRLAKLVPYITSADQWEIEAEVKIGERKYHFKESWKSAPPLPKTPIGAEEFDSSIEQEFYRQVSRLCKVEREPEAIVVDGRIYIPDFKIGDLYVEIVGFWTPDYLKRKYEKVVKAGKPILVLVAEELAMATWKEHMPNVVIFKGRPRLSDVYKYIKPYCFARR